MTEKWDDIDPTFGFLLLDSELWFMDGFDAVSRNFHVVLHLVLFGMSQDATKSCALLLFFEPFSPSNVGLSTIP